MTELDQIAVEAKGLENDQQAAQDAILNQEAEQAPAVDPAAVWATLPKMFSGILAMAFPELEKAYTDDKCYAWGGAMNLVAEKYQWDAAETMAKWGPEIALTMATLPLAIPTIKVIKRALDEAKKEKPLDGDNLVKQAPEQAETNVTQ